MSYDVDIGDAEFNYTWNMGPMFRAGMPDGIAGLNGLTGRQAFKRLDAALTKLSKERYADEFGFRAKHNAPNGWGDVDSAFQFLRELRAACDRYPRHRVKVN